MHEKLSNAPALIEMLEVETTRVLDYLDKNLLNSGGTK